MEPSPTLDLSRWRETPRGVGYRRWSIVTLGLRQLIRTKHFRAVLIIAWCAGALIAAAGFLFSQSVATGGWLETFAERLGPRVEAVVSAVGAFVLLYPDICVRGVFTLIFWAHSFLGLWLSLIALTSVVPNLITRDRGSNALIVYLSRPLTSVDYLLGKLGIIVGVLALVWTGPLVFGWLLSMLFATDRDFIVYSFAPLLRALLFNGLGLVTLAAIALGVSALGRLPRVTVAVWMCLWVIFGVLATERHSPDWLKRISFTRDLSEVRQEVFKLDDVLGVASAQLPILDQRLTKNLAGASKRAEPTDVDGSLAALGFFVVGASFVFFRKLRPE